MSASRARSDHGRADLQRKRPDGAISSRPSSRPLGAAASRSSLVIVDDNSPDGTGAIADELARTYPAMQVIHRAGKLGLGTAVVAGFGGAAAEVVGVMDADFSHPPALVPRMRAVFQATERRRACRQPVHARRQHAELAVSTGGSVARWRAWLARPLSPIRDAASGFFLIQRDDRAERRRSRPAASRSASSSSSAAGQRGWWKSRIGSTIVSSARAR